MLNLFPLCVLLLLLLSFVGVVVVVVFCCCLLLLLLLLFTFVWLQLRAMLWMQCHMPHAFEQNGEYEFRIRRTRVLATGAVWEVTVQNLKNDEPAGE